MALGYDLKSAEDVKEYLKNLHIEYKFGCYSEKNPEVCHLLANFKEAVKKDFEKSAALYKSNCDERNYPRSCSKYGDYSIIGKGTKKDPKEAYKYLCKACDLDNSSGCLHAGIFAITTADLEDDASKQVERGLKMLRKSCNDQSNEKACFYLSGIYMKGIKGYVEANSKEAYKLSLKACEFGNPYACSNIAQMHQKGDGVKQDDELAKLFKDRADLLHREIKQARTLQFQQGIKT